MIILVFAAVVIFCWLVARSVHAGYGKLLLWLGTFLIGSGLMMAMQMPEPHLRRVIVGAYLTLVFGLPVFWLLSWWQRRVRGEK